MQRYKLVIEYDGGPFLGWQQQKNEDRKTSIQGELQRAVHAFCGEDVQIYGAGRTDAGVHALGQVAHLDLLRETSAFRLQEALNFHLQPQPIAILSAQPVSSQFHARFNARQRHYLYRIVDRRPPLTLLNGHVWRIKQPLNLKSMQEAANYLLGTHDFTTFRDSQCQATTPVKSLDKAEIYRLESGEIQARFAALSFLYRQIRSMMGSLVEVGRGKWRVKDLAGALTATDRQACGPVAPPDGLYLSQVDYDEI